LPLHFLTAGAGPDLVLLHGLGASSFSWRHNLDPLARHFRVWAPDLPGHGRSPAEPWGDYRLEALAGEVLSFMNRQGLGRAALGGNSLGGALALLLAGRQPERVAALVLLAPAAAPDRLPFLFYPLRLPALGWILATLLGPWVIPPALRLIYHHRDRITPEVISGYAAPLRDRRRRLALRRLCQQAQVWPRPRLEELLNQIRQPVALIWGERDRILPPAQALFLQARLPQAELHLLPEVGHAPQEEAPNAVNKIIIAFLTRSLKN
jgi:pimeloyl-ACP methyl ester carboxylesterase